MLHLAPFETEYTASFRSGLLPCNKILFPSPGIHFISAYLNSPYPIPYTAERRPPCVTEWSSNGAPHLTAQFLICPYDLRTSNHGPFGVETN